MTELRRRMIKQMTLRGFSPRTHESYIAAVRGTEPLLEPLRRLLPMLPEGFRQA